MAQISIIICTRDRQESLAATLRSVGGARIPAGCAVELIVVDNGCAEATRRVVEAATLAGVAPRYVAEPKKGHGHAYNAGIAAAKGDILLCTDDDVRVPANWIEGMTAPILEGRYDAVAGGVVFPPRIAFILSRRPFATRRNWFASSDYLDPDQPGAMIGANMAYHRRVLGESVGFDLELGPGALGFHQESLFSLQLVAAGYRLGGALEVAVEHHFDTRRLTRAGMLDIAGRMGRSRAFIEYHWNHRRVALPRLKMIQARLLAGAARLGEKLGLAAPGVVWGPLLRFTEDAAYFAGHLVQRKRAPKYPPSAARGAKQP